jgi:hypothetical protein
MEPLVLFTGGALSAMFIALKSYAIAAVFFLLTVLVAALLRRYDERNRWR